MKKVYILVEGPTEEKFVKEVLDPYYSPQEIYFYPIIITTKRVLRGPDHKGGLTSFMQLRTDLTPLLYSSAPDIITTMLDYYALPSDFPGFESKPRGTASEITSYLEAKLKESVPDPRFIPYFQLHEFEALIFACPDKLHDLFFEEKHRRGILEVSNLIQAVASPEEINDGVETAPSKRLKRFFPEYQKPLHGPLILSDANLLDVRGQCPHFDNWLYQIENR